MLKKSAAILLAWDFRITNEERPTIVTGKVRKALQHAVLTAYMSQTFAGGGHPGCEKSQLELEADCNKWLQTHVNGQQGVLEMQNLPMPSMLLYFVKAHLLMRQKHKWGAVESPIW